MTPNQSASADVVGSLASASFFVGTALFWWFRQSQGQQHQQQQQEQQRSPQLSICRSRKTARDDLNEHAKDAISVTPHLTRETSAVTNASASSDAQYHAHSTAAAALWRLYAWSGKANHRLSFTNLNEFVASADNELEENSIMGGPAEGRHEAETDFYPKNSNWHHFERVKAIGWDRSFAERDTTSVSPYESSLEEEEDEEEDDDNDDDEHEDNDVTPSSSEDEEDGENDVGTGDSYNGGEDDVSQTVPEEEEDISLGSRDHFVWTVARPFVFRSNKTATNRRTKAQSRFWKTQNGDPFKTLPMITSERELEQSLLADIPSLSTNQTDTKRPPSSHGVAVAANTAMSSHSNSFPKNEFASVSPTLEELFSGDPKQLPTQATSTLGTLQAISKLSTKDDRPLPPRPQQRTSPATNDNTVTRRTYIHSCSLDDRALWKANETKVWTKVTTTTAATKNVDATSSTDPTPHASILPPAFKRRSISESNLNSRQDSGAGVHGIAMAESHARINSRSLTVSERTLLDQVVHQNRVARAHYNARIMPKKLILIRHGQSMGNMDEDLYSRTPDNSMPLTALGWEQARAAGKHLRNVVLQQTDPSELVHFIVSPYVRTVETFHGIVSAWSDPAEFQHIRDRDLRIRAWYSRLLQMGLTWHEDPRIREQDFGNYQDPETIKLSKRQRQDFGAFYYRFANGESASDVFDRISTFLDSLWRSFDSNKCQNYVVVTHGIAIRVLLTRYFRYTVDQFHLLANPRNCEMVVLAHDGMGRLELAGRCEPIIEMITNYRDSKESCDHHCSPAPADGLVDDDERPKKGKSSQDGKDKSQREANHNHNHPQRQQQQQQHHQHHHHHGRNGGHPTMHVSGYRFYKRLRVLPAEHIRRSKIRISVNDVPR